MRDAVPARLNDCHAETGRDNVIFEWIQPCCRRHIIRVEISCQPERIPIRQHFQCICQSSQENGLAPWVVLVFYHKVFSIVNNTRDIPLKAVEMAVWRAVEVDHRRPTLRGMSAGGGEEPSKMSSCVRLACPYCDRVQTQFPQAKPARSQKRLGATCRSALDFIRF